MENKDIGDIEIKAIVPPSDLSGLTKLNGNPDAFSHMSSFVHDLVPLGESALLGNAYIVKFPEGCQHVLMKCRNGEGFRALIPNTNGKGIAGQVSLHKLNGTAVMGGVFAVLSMVTSQYYLKNINDQLHSINAKLDQIISFLEDDKKGKLKSNRDFLVSCIRDYDRIMRSEAQRISTISSIQDIRRDAMHNIEFYFSRLEKNNEKEIAETLEKAKEYSECLSFSAELYAVSYYAEMIFSQNSDKLYIDDIKQDIACAFYKCERASIKAFDDIYRKIGEKRTIRKRKERKAYREEVVAIRWKLRTFGVDSEFRKTMAAAFNKLNEPTELYLLPDGTTYIRTT